MARNKEEQINYLLKRRQSTAMSQQDFKEELKYLYELGYMDGRTYHVPTISVRE